MRPKDYAAPKFYVVRFPRSKRKKPRVVHGWKAVQRLRRNERVSFRAFHTEHGAELHMRNLGAERQKSAVRLAAEARAAGKLRVNGDFLFE